MKNKPAKRSRIAAASSVDGEIIVGQFGGEVVWEISAESSMPEGGSGVQPDTRTAVGAGADGGAGAKLDTPDAKGGKDQPGPLGDKAKSKDGKVPLPKFTLSAYNGGPMRLAGFYHPVVIDAAGVRFATENMPVYVGHPAEGAPASEMMEALVGQAKCSVSNGRITATGQVTSSSKTVGEMLNHARKGFKFQNSVHGRPVEMSFIRAGESAMVNGQTVNGPVSVARQSVLDHIAILPLGADTTTSADIAATGAAGETNMEWNAWLKAEYGMDQAQFDGLSESRRATMKAEFEAGGKDTKKADPQPKIEATGAINAEAQIKAQNEALAANMARVASINETARNFPAIAAQAVRENWSVEKTENAVLKAERDAMTAQTFGASNVGHGLNMTAQNFSRVLEASVLLSCGYDGERLVKDRHYGEQVVNETDKLFRAEGRQMTPSHIAVICARAAGVTGLPHGHGDDFWTAVLANDRICPKGGQKISAEFSTMSLPVALSNVMNKYLLDAYLSVDPNDCDPAGGVAWKQFCRVTSVQDFKPHYRIRLVPDLLLKKLLKSGEIEHGTIGEQSYMLTADTKAIMLGLSRVDLINDDQSVLSSLPTHFGIGAAETVANDIYYCLLADLQSDGATAFFTASDVTTAGNKMKANLLTSQALSFATLEETRAQFAIQTKPTGRPAGILGKILLVPPQLAGLARQLCESDYLIASLSTGGNARGTAQNNNLKGLQRPVSSAYLANGATPSSGAAAASGSASTWFLSAAATSPAYPIEIGFLNGQETPIIERAEADFNRLGISFRTFLDYGVAMSEPRSIVKNTQ